MINFKKQKIFYSLKKKKIKIRKNKDYIMIKSNFKER